MTNDNNDSNDSIINDKWRMVMILLMKWQWWPILVMKVMILINVILMINDIMTNDDNSDELLVMNRPMINDDV